MLHDLVNDDTSHSSGQLRTERDGETEKGCQKPVIAEDY